MAPNSLALRLVLGAAALMAVVLLAGGLALSTLFRDYVVESFDARLSVLLESLVAVAELDGDGGVRLSRGIGEPRFEQPLSGWYWQIGGPVGPLLRSRSLWDEALPLRDDATLAESRRREIEGPEGQGLRLMERDIALPSSTERWRFAVAGDRGEIEAAMRAFNTTLAWSLGLLGLGLLVALLIQVRFGLLPLRRIRRAIAAIRAGRAQRLDGAFPVEIAPLADELNLLLEHNAAVVERARTQASNLAHSLKTPLSVLINDADDLGGPLAETVKRQAMLMRRQVDHHLSRARTAAAARVLGSGTEVSEVVEGLRRTLGRIHLDRPITIETRVPARLRFRGERQDLEEMIGNLADNACKWAGSLVVITGREEGDTMLCIVDDDGPGLPAAEHDAVFDRGRRLDETVPGTGHGLAIARDIAELYDGSITLERSDLGGLRATLSLPAVATGRNQAP